MSTLQFAEISSKINVIKGKVLETLNSNPLYTQAAQRITKELADKAAENQLRVTFVGQYSAGKSTIISALTGNNHIRIDSDIATDNTSDYHWHNVVLTDTPGLYTQRKDHDQVTENAIKNADILVYCLTYSLFDNILLENFNKLAYDRGYAPKMLIVVNKMFSEFGEYEELVENYTVTLKNSLGANKLEQFPVSFISAQMQRDEEPEMREYSHFADFVSQLETFIKDNDQMAKLTTPAHILIDGMTQALISENSGNDQEYHALLNRIESKLKRIQRECELDFRTEMEKLQNEIELEGVNCSNRIGQEQMEPIFEGSSRKIENFCEETRIQLMNSFDDKKSDLYAALQEIQESDLAKNFIHNTLDLDGVQADVASIKLGQNSTAIDVEKVQKIQSLLNYSSKGLVKLATGTAGQTTGLLTSTAAAGSALNHGVLSVGHFFGATFKPWQAVNIAKNIGNFAKFLGPIAIGIGIITDFMESQRREEEDQKIRKAQREVRAQFNENAKDVLQQFSRQYQELLQQMVIEPILEIQKIREDSLRKSEAVSAAGKELSSFIQELKQLIKTI